MNWKSILVTRRNAILCFIIITSVLGSLSSQQEGRYTQSIFTTITETSGVQFSTNVPQPINEFDWNTFVSGGLPMNVAEYNNQNVNLFMDIFEPAEDEVEKRALIILCFGGGFVSGGRDHWSMRLLAQGLAKMGYVTASIDYRLGMNIKDENLGNRAVYRAIQDSRSAVRFFKSDADNANIYKINTNSIFIGGHSSGAFMALHNIYLDKDSDRPMSTKTWSQDGNVIPDLGCLDCVGDNLGYSGQADGLFSLAGALGALNYIENATEPPPLLFHSTDDATVPEDTGEPFSAYSFALVGEDLPTVYGSSPISLRCDTLGLVHKYNSYSGRGHGVHELGSIALQPDIIPEISAWFFEKHLKPIPTPISGPAYVCASEPIQDYVINNHLIKYHKWQITGGTIIDTSVLSNSANVEWDPAATIHELKLKPFSCNGSQGEELAIEVNIVDGGSNQWTGGQGAWNEDFNWTNNYVPLPCEHVLVNSESQSTEISLAENLSVQILSLLLGNNIVLRIPANSSLEIKN